MTEKKTEKPLGFEKALEKLEALVNEMEGGELSLEHMMKNFEEGSQLVTYCEDKLNEVERKIEILVKKGEQLKTEAFEKE